MSLEDKPEITELYVPSSNVEVAYMPKFVVPEALLNVVLPKSEVLLTIIL